MTPAVASSHRKGRWPGLLGRFRRDERGAYAVEFALIALPFFGLLFATIEVAWVSFNGEELQAAVDSAARKVLTGQAQTNNYASAAAFTSALLCPTNGTRLIPSSWDCSKLIVDIRPAASFSAADVSHAFYASPTQYCLGNPSTIVVMRVAYPMAAVFPLSTYNRYLGLSNNVPNMSGWYHILLGTAVFKTEPYSGASPAC